MHGRDAPVAGLTGEEHRNGRSPEARPRRQLHNREVRPPTKGVVRRIDVWSVFKVSVLFYVAVYCILLVAAVLLWMAATATGLRDNIEQVVADLIASGKFHFVGTELLQAAAVGGAVLVIVGTGANLMLAVLYNLISDVVGGVSIVVDQRSVRGARQPEPASAAAPAADVSAEPPRVLIPEVEVRQARPAPQAAPAPRPAPQAPPAPAPAADAEPPTLLIPEVEVRQAREAPPAPAPRPEEVTRPEAAEQQLSGAERATDVGLDAFWL